MRIMSDEVITPITSVATTCVFCCSWRFRNEVLDWKKKIKRIKIEQNTDVDYKTDRTIIGDGLFLQEIYILIWYCPEHNRYAYRSMVICLVFNFMLSRPKTIFQTRTKNNRLKVFKIASRNYFSHIKVCCRIPTETELRVYTLYTRRG